MPLVPMPYPLLILTLTRCGQYDIQKPTDTCWFALQCSVGFESALPVDTDLDTLIPLVMPWTLLGAHGAADPSTPTVIVRLTGLLVTAGGQFSPLSINPVAVIPTSSTNAFAKSLRKDATQRLMALAKDQPSSVLWKLADDGLMSMNDTVLPSWLTTASRFRFGDIASVVGSAVWMRSITVMRLEFSTTISRRPRSIMYMYMPICWRTMYGVHWAGFDGPGSEGPWK